MLIWRKTSSAYSGTNTVERGGIRQLSSCHTVGMIASTMDSTAYSVPGIVQVADLCPFSHTCCMHRNNPAHDSCFGMVPFTMPCRATGARCSERREEGPTGRTHGKPMLLAVSCRCYSPRRGECVQSAEVEMGDTGRAPGIPGIDIATH
jgi:hypothetical protein